MAPKIEAVEATVLASNGLFFVAAHLLGVVWSKDELRSLPRNVTMQPARDSLELQLVSWSQKHIHMHQSFCNAPAKLKTNSAAYRHTWMQLDADCSSANCISSALCAVATLDLDETQALSSTVVGHVSLQFRLGGYVA